MLCRTDMATEKRPLTFSKSYCDYGLLLLCLFRRGKKKILFIVWRSIATPKKKTVDDAHAHTQMNLIRIQFIH